MENFCLTLSRFTEILGLSFMNSDHRLISKALYDPSRVMMVEVRLNIFELWQTLNLWVSSTVVGSREDVAHSVNIPRHLKVNLLGFVAFSLSIKETYSSSCRGASGIKAF